MVSLLLQILHTFSNYTYFDSSQADKKKKEGNRLYNNRNYRCALQRYSEAIGNNYIKTFLKSTSNYVVLKYNIHTYNDFLYYRIMSRVSSLLRQPFSVSLDTIPVHTSPSGRQILSGIRYGFR